MVEIIIYIIIFFILVFVLSIAVKAITRGVEAKQLNKDDKYSEHKNENQNLQVINQIKELKDLHEKGVLNDNEFEKAKEKVLK